MKPALAISCSLRYVSPIRRGEYVSRPMFFSKLVELLAVGGKE